MNGLYIKFSVLEEKKKGKICLSVNHKIGP